MRKEVVFLGEAAIKVGAKDLVEKVMQMKVLENRHSERRGLRCRYEKATVSRLKLSQEVRDFWVHNVLEHPGLPITGPVGLDQRLDLVRLGAQFREACLKWRPDKTSQLGLRDRRQADLLKRGLNALDDAFPGIGQRAIKVEEDRRTLQLLAALYISPA